MGQHWIEVQQWILPQRYVVVDCSPGLAARAVFKNRRIHDHVTWCVRGVIQGVEHEERFDAHLNLLASNENEVRDLRGFAPPGDIHRVHNIADITAISIDVYGADLPRVGYSAGRCYD